MNGPLDQNVLLWHGAIATASKIYSATAEADTRYADLQERMRCSALRLATNLAQAGTHAKRLERIGLLSSAASTLAELDTQIHIAIDLGILDPKLCIATQVARLRTQLASVIRSLQEQRNRDTAPPAWQVSVRTTGFAGNAIDQTAS
jgi:four helix bundle protein